jgi:protein-arginine kinase activator protein McsA
MTDRVTCEVCGFRRPMRFTTYDGVLIDITEPCTHPVSRIPKDAEREHPLQLPRSACVRCNTPFRNNRNSNRRYCADCYKIVKKEHWSRYYHSLTPEQKRAREAGRRKVA